MKFAYIDESGGKGQSDVFVMAGLLIDASKLRKYTAEFDVMINDFLVKHPSAPEELKTKALINGVGGWRGVDADDRKQFLSNVCELAVSCSRIYAIGFSFNNFDLARRSASENPPFDKSYWVGAAMYVAGLVQKKMQGEKNNKGLTVIIFDDNKIDMPKVSDRLYTADPWFDPLYQIKKSRRGKRDWQPIKQENRFDHIINSAFAIKSEHSSLVQVADAVSYVYRRHLELKTEAENWVGEKEYYENLVNKLDTKREKLGHTPDGPCVEFYTSAKHDEWAL